MRDDSIILSIVVPCYNGERFLRRCISSLLNQRDVSVEVIIVDDCSTDRSWQVAGELDRDHVRCRSIRQTLNQGVACARNLGLSLCQGRFVMFVDADDWLYPEACQRLLEEQARTGADLVLGGFDYADDTGRSWPACPARRRMPAGYYGNIFATPSFYRCQGMFDSSCGRLFRLDAIRKHGLQFPEKLGFGEDACFVLSYLAACPRVAVMDGDSCYVYFQHVASSVHQLDIHRRLKQLLGILTVSQSICREHQLDEHVLLHKSKEVMFAVKRFGGDATERGVLLQWLWTQNAKAFQRLLEVVVCYGKPKHRMLAWLMLRHYWRLSGVLLAWW